MASATKRAFLGSLAGRTAQFLKQFLPKSDLVFFTSTPHNDSKATFRERINLEEVRWLQQTILNRHWKIEKVHYLGDSRARNSFSSGYSCLVQPRNRLQFLPPLQRQLERMWPPVPRLSFFLLLQGDFCYNIGWEWDRGANVRGSSPPGEGYREGQSEIPRSSDSTHASGASSPTEIRTSRFNPPPSRVGGEPPPAKAWEQEGGVE